MTAPTVVWSSVSGFDGQLTWIPEDLDAPPAACVCGSLLLVTERAADERPTRLACGRGHQWRGTIDVLEARLTAGATKGAADRPRCVRCGEFLSATRVEMRIDRCASCDRPRGRAAR